MTSDKPIRATLTWELNGKHELLLHEGDTAAIGRHEDNDVVLEANYISRHHAVIAWRDAGFDIQDLGSINGTSVNDEPISQPHRLQDGDIIKLYELELRYSIYEQEEAPAPRANVTQTEIVVPIAPQPSLVISAGAQEGRKIILRYGTMVIGRATARTESWDIALADRAVSRPHAQIEGSDQGFVLSDLGSANRTLLNGSELAAPTLLKEGDVIVIGETTMIFRSV
jgi:pSer/pThr/pTyr-binding forkhead associated (FHA) protein